MNRKTCSSSSLTARNRSAAVGFAIGVAILTLMIGDGMVDREIILERGFIWCGSPCIEPGSG